MSQGFCPALLTTVNDVANGNAPGQKMQIAGYLAMLFCCQNSTVNPINTLAFDGASYRPLTVAYTRRPLVSSVTSTDDCAIDRIPSYSEWQIPTLGFKKSSFFIDDNTLMQYCTDFVATRSAGRPPTQVMREIYDRIVETANVLLRAINQDLVTQQITRFGVNVTTHQSNGKVINVDQDGAKYVLDNGIIDLMRDIQENEICGEPCLVGGGLWEAWRQSQVIACCSAAGMDMSKIGLPRLFFDKDTQQIWGPNTAGLFAPGSVKFIGRNAYQGPFAGQRGTSFFTTLPMPVQDFGCNNDDCLRDLMFDLQMKYADCPQTGVSVGGVSTNIGRGWEIIISKRYALWVQPGDAYAVGDPLYDTNGTLKYYLTNTASDPAAYAYGY